MQTPVPVANTTALIKDAPKVQQATILAFGDPNHPSGISKVQVNNNAEEESESDDSDSDSEDEAEEEKSSSKVIDTTDHTIVVAHKH